VRRGDRVVHGDKELIEKLGRNDVRLGTPVSKSAAYAPAASTVASVNTTSGTSLRNGLRPIAHFRRNQRPVAQWTERRVSAPGLRGFETCPEHDAEKWIPVFGKHHAPAIA
jgi:hypothetical protein